MWKKGLSGNPAGGGKGPKSRKWETLEYWMAQLHGELNRTICTVIKHKNGDVSTKIQPAVSADTKARIYADLFKVVLARKGKAAKTPAESVSNANDALNALNELVNDGRKEKGNRDSDSLADRRPNVQAKQNPTLDAGGLGSEQKPQ